MDLNTINTLLIDGDGVLYKLDDPLPGLNSLFEQIEARGINWALVTNNATRTRTDYLNKLTKLGLKADVSQIFSSASVTGLTLQKRYDPGTAFYVIGADGLVKTLEESGFKVYNGQNSPPEPVAAVVMGLDIDISYPKLAVATILIRSGVPFILTNPDQTFPSPMGILPGAGSLGAALRASTSIEPEIIGKPQGAIFQAAMDHFGVSAETTAMLGDRMETDILGAQQLGIKTILVLSGVTSREQLADFDYQPDIILDGIADLACELEKT